MREAARLEGDLVLPVADVALGPMVVVAVFRNHFLITFAFLKSHNIAGTFTVSTPGDSI